MINCAPAINEAFRTVEDEPTFVTKSCSALIMAYFICCLIVRHKTTNGRTVLLCVRCGLRLSSTAVNSLVHVSCEKLLLLLLQKKETNKNNWPHTHKRHRHANSGVCWQINALSRKLNFTRQSTAPRAAFIPYTPSIFFNAVERISDIHCWRVKSVVPIRWRNVCDTSVRWKTPSAPSLPIIVGKQTNKPHGHESLRSIIVKHCCCNLAPFCGPIVYWWV